MIISVAVLKGFQQEIYDKITGFSGHLHISNFSSNVSLNSNNFVCNDSLVANIKLILPNSNVAAYAIKGGIIKTNTAIEGAVLKGVDKNYDWKFFEKNLLEGKTPNINNDSIHEILISKILANKLQLKLHQKLFMYFIQEPARIRKFYIVGIYSTGLEEFDNKFLFCGINNIQKLNNWHNNEADAYEVTIPSNIELKEATEKLYYGLQSNLNVENVQELFPQLFDWLNLQNINVIIIIAMMFLVGTINMITALLIIILEKTKTVGLLKAMGANNSDIRKMFLLNVSKLIFKGALIGNIIGISIVALQHFYHLIPLDASSYYMQYVPTKFDIMSFVFINIASITTSILCMIIPTLIIQKISPAKAIKF